MKKPIPKIRKYTVPNVPELLIDVNKLDVFIIFLPIKPKYYKLISAKVEDTDHYMDKNINFVFEKLQNLKSFKTN